MRVRVDFLNQPQFTVFPGGCGRGRVLVGLLSLCLREEGKEGRRGRKGRGREGKGREGKGEEDCGVSTVKSACVRACTLSPRSRAQSPALCSSTPPEYNRTSSHHSRAFSFLWYAENFPARRLKMDSCVSSSVRSPPHLAVGRPWGKSCLVKEDGYPCSRPSHLFLCHR